MLQKVLRIVVLTFIPAVLLAHGTKAGESAPLQGFDRYVRQAMHAWHIPGLAVAVVKDGKLCRSG